MTVECNCVVAVDMTRQDKTASMCTRLVNI